MGGREKDILMGIVIGDALGSAVDGLGKGHIRAHFRSIGNYIDPTPALKGNMAKWKKPGLYSSISQFAFLLALCPPRRAFIDSFRRYVAESPAVGNSESGIFRYPDGAERRFIASVRDQRPSHQTSSPPCSRVLPAAVPISFRTGRLAERISDTISYASLFTRDVQTVAAAVSFVCLAGSLPGSPEGAVDFIRASIEVNGMILGSIAENPGAIFELRLNPDHLAEEISLQNAILEKISRADTLKEAEDVICRMINPRLKTPVTRATVDLPAAILPFAISLSSLHQNDPGALFAAVSEGGSTAVLSSMAGALLAGRFGAERLPEVLIRDLVNRRRVLALTDALDEGSIPHGRRDEFLNAEASLTSKELDELAAKVKHARNKPKKESRTRGDQEKQLTRHVVESWTKLDRARWKKERRGTNKKDEF